MKSGINSLSSQLVMISCISLILMTLTGCMIYIFIQRDAGPLVTIQFSQDFEPPKVESEKSISAWGASHSGEPQGSGWEVISDTELTQNKTVNAWSGIWFDNPPVENYKIVARVKGIQSGMQSKYPKYGLYAVYKDKWNYFSIWLDRQYKVLATYGMVNGKSINWANTDLTNVNFDDYVELKAIKIGDTVQVYVNGEMLQKVKVSIEKGQAGLVTEDTKASYKDISLSTNMKAFD